MTTPGPAARKTTIRLALALWLFGSVSPASEPERFEVPTPQEINAGLRRWEQERPHLLRVEEIGKSITGFPILLCRFTDHRVPGEDKQRVLLTASHTSERSAPSHMLFLARWLLSGDPEAVKMLERQEILMIPLPSPDQYDKRDPERDVYGWWEPLNIASDPKIRPEKTAYKKVIDTYLPEAHLDLHGFDDPVKGLGFGTCSINYRGAAAGWGRSFLADMPGILDRAAEEKGFTPVYGDEGDGTITVSAPVPGANEHYYARGGRMVAWVYTYRKAHAVSMILESGYAEQYMAAAKALLLEGQKTGRWERYPGYAVNQVACELSIAVSAWGDTAANRRASRVELWAKKANLNPGVFKPEMRGYVSGLLVTDPELRKRLMLDPDGKIVGEPKLMQFLSNLEREPSASQYDIEGIRNSLRHARNIRNPDDMTVFMNHHNTVNKPTDDPLIHSGVNIRAFIPYKNPRIKQVLLDGSPCPQHETDGYTVYHYPGTIVEFSIPPAKTKALHVVTVVYEPDEERLYGFSKEHWNLPQRNRHTGSR